MAMSKSAHSVVMLNDIISVTNYMTGPEILAVQTGTYGSGVATLVTASINSAIADMVAKTIDYDSGIHTSTSPQLFFPSGYYKITSGIDLRFATYATRIYGEKSIIEQQTAGQAIFFNAYGVNNMTIESFIFVGSDTRAIYITTTLGVINADTRLNIVDCDFQTANTSVYAIELSQNALMARIYNAGVQNAQLFLTADIDQCFIYGGTIEGDLRSTTKKAANTCSIVNNCGHMKMQDVMFVPQSHATAEANTRWIDNYGDIELINCRFGAEANGGFPAIYQFVNGPKLNDVSPYMSGSININGGYYYTGASARADKGIVVLQNNVIPGTITISGITGPFEGAFVSAWGYDANTTTANAELAARIQTQQAASYAVRINITILGNSQYASTFVPSSILPYTLYNDAVNTTNRAALQLPGHVIVDSTYNTSTGSVSLGYIGGSRHQPFIPGQKVAGITSGVAFDVITFLKDTNAAGGLSSLTGILSVHFMNIYAGPNYATAYKEFLVQITASGASAMTLAQKDVMFLSTVFGDILTLALKAGAASSNATIQVIATDANIVAADAHCTWSFRHLSGTSTASATAYTIRATSA